MSGSTIKDILQQWSQDVQKAAESSEESRLAAKAIPGDERNKTVSNPGSGTDTITSPHKPADTNTDSNSTPTENNLRNRNSPGIIQPDGGTGTNVDKRDLVDSSPTLDNHPLIKTAEGVTQLANSITQAVLAKQAGMRAGTHKGHDNLELTPEVIRKMASIVNATKHGYEEQPMNKRAAVSNYLRNMTGNRFEKQAMELQQLGAHMAQQDMLEKRAHELIGFIKAAEEELAEIAPEMVEDVEDAGAGEELTIGDVADVLVDAVEAGEIDPAEADAILEEVIEETLGEASMGDEAALEEDVTPEDVLDVITEMVETGEIDPDTAAEMVAKVSDPGVEI